MVPTNYHGVAAAPQCESLLKCYGCGGSKPDHDHTIINLGVLIVATTGTGGKIARSPAPAALDIIRLGVRAAMWNCYPAEMELGLSNGAERCGIVRVE